MKIKGWKIVSRIPPMWVNKMKKNLYVGIGQAPDGKYDVWVQRDTRVSKWIAGGHTKKTVSKSQALRYAKDFMDKYKSKIKKVL